MTNLEIIETASALQGYEYDGENLKTFNEWKKAGFSVKKGEKAFLVVDLWKPFKKKVKDEKTGEEKEEKRFMLKKSHLFTPEQVQVIVEKKEKASKTPQTVEEVVEVTATAETTEQPENDVKQAWFSRKPCNIFEVIEREYADYDRYQIAEEVKMSKDEFLMFQDDLLKGYDFLKGKGGTQADVDFTDSEGNDLDFYSLSEAQRKEFYSKAYRLVVRVSCEELNTALLVDPQGHDYGRYVAIEG